MSLIIGILTFVLVILSILMVLLVLAQKAKSDGGMAAMGGGAMESAFGPDTGNVLSKYTIRLAVTFFVLSFGLFLLHIHQNRAAKASAKDALPSVIPAALPAAPVTPAPEATTPAPVAPVDAPKTP